MRAVVVFISLLVWLSDGRLTAQTPSPQQLLQCGLPLLEVTTVDGEEPSCDYVSPPDGMGGRTIDNATKVPGRLRKWVDGTCVYDSGDYMADSSGMRIKIRGNTSAYEPKKSFKVKLEKKADLLCRDSDSVYADKEWLLMKEDYNVVGGELLYLMIGLKTSELCGMPWEPKAEFVNLTVNGDYRGIYMLCEAVKRGSGHRVDVCKSNGYIIEQNPYWWKEKVWFSTDRHGKTYTFKYPDSDDVDTLQVAYMKSTMDDVEGALWDGTFDTVVDVDIMAAWLMAHDILGTSDAAGSNIFMTKHDNTPDSKMMMGPLWDFGSIMRMHDQWASIHTSEISYFHYLLHMAAGFNRPFIDAYMRLWEEKAKDVPEEMIDFLSDFKNSDVAADLQEAYQWDMERWQHPNPSVDQMIQNAVDWFNRRKAWMTSMMPMLGIREDTLVTSHTGTEQSVRYVDLSGRHASPQQAGCKIEIGHGRAFKRMFKNNN